MSNYSQDTVLKAMPSFDFSKHVLTEIQSGEHLSAYTLSVPGRGRMDSVMILDTPEGIVLLGDWCPNHNRGAIALHYHLGWFSGNLSLDYMLEKFGIEEKWQSDLAAEQCRWWLECELENITSELGEVDEENGDEPEPESPVSVWLKKELAKTNEQLAYELESPSDAEDYFNAAPEELTSGDSWYERLDGTGPALRDVAVLWAIQKRFAVTYRELLESKAKAKEAAQSESEQEAAGQAVEQVAG